MTQLKEGHIKAISGILGETQKGFTKTELTRFLRDSQIKIQDDGSREGQYRNQFGLNKRDWLYNCLLVNAQVSKDANTICVFIEKCMDPVNFSQQEKRVQYEWLYAELSKVLLMLGIELGRDGKLRTTTISTTLDEVDKRVNNLQRELYVRKIHTEVVKYCNKELLADNYYHSVFEAAKGLADRIRNLTGLTLDGSALFQKVFSKDFPYIVFNEMKNKSDISEQNGVRELCDSIYHLIRNTTAHRVKLNCDIDETKALDMFSLISTAHKYLDKSIIVPRT